MEVIYFLLFKKNDINIKCLYVLVLVFKFELLINSISHLMSLL